MRVEPHGNLTITLIRLARFGGEAHRPFVHRPGTGLAQPGHVRVGAAHAAPCRSRQIDSVVLTTGAREHDPWSDNRKPSAVLGGTPWQPTEHPSPTPIQPAPRELTPVIGAPALAGLGVALIVPGTLLDVVA